MAYITPIRKGGSRQDPTNNRSVSLTSHVMKVFERVIKKCILEHLELHDLIKRSQHGFVPCHSTQTILLQHCRDVFEAMLENTIIDTIVSVSYRALFISSALPPIRKIEEQ